MAGKAPKYKACLEQWKRELSAELQRDVTYDEIARRTGIGYSTLMKHSSRHLYARPDYAIAARICAFFNALSGDTRAIDSYFEEVDPESHLVAVPA